MMVKFVGGTEDGKSCILPHAARYYFVPLPVKHCIEEFIYLDYRPTKPQAQRYRRVWYDSEYDEAIYLYEGTE